MTNTLTREPNTVLAPRDDGLVNKHSAVVFLHKIGMLWEECSHGWLVILLSDLQRVSFSWWEILIFLGEQRMRNAVLWFGPMQAFDLLENPLLLWGFSLLNRLTWLSHNDDCQQAFRWPKVGFVLSNFEIYPESYRSDSEISSWKTAELFQTTTSWRRYVEEVCHRLRQCLRFSWFHYSEGHFQF